MAGSSSHLFWIIHGRMQGTPLQTKPVMHISHEKNISSTNMSIYCACRYIHIYIIYVYYVISYSTYWDSQLSPFGILFRKIQLQRKKKNVVWNLPWPLQQVAPCRLAGTDPANTSVRPGNPRRSLPLSS